MQCYHYFKGSLYTFEGLLIVSGTFTETCFSFFFFEKVRPHFRGESSLMVYHSYNCLGRSKIDVVKFKRYNFS